MAIADNENGRILGGTEKAWCHAVTSGTGNTVLALKLSKSSSETSRLARILSVIKQSHPLLGRKLDYDPAGKTFRFANPAANPPPEIAFHDGDTTRALIDPESKIPPLQQIVEHEMRADERIWSDPDSFPRGSGVPLIFAAVYALSASESVVAFRFHTSACDRTTAVSFLSELLELVSTAEDDGGREPLENSGEGEAALESLIPSGFTGKGIWTRGRDMLGYSLSALRMKNLEFVNLKMPRKSNLVRLHVNQRLTSDILSGCKSRGIKLCGILTAAILLAVASGNAKKNLNKYGVVTLTDCRSFLHPPLSVHHYGFYHSAILNTYAVKGTETLWKLATSCYAEFSKMKQNNKHLTDMADINFLMTKAVENPGLTSHSSLRSALVTVFEDSVVDDSGGIRRQIGVDDYIGCSSVHGIGPSIAVFDTVRDGELDCILVYPSPLHSREQIEEIAAKMTTILARECSSN